jgi:hypothetical protein
MPEFADIESIEGFNEFYQMDILETINTEQKAQRYVEDLFSTMTESELQECAEIYFGNDRPSISCDRPRNTKRQRIRGGGYYECDDTKDIRVYKLLEAFDSIHDICTKSSSGTQTVYKYGISPLDIFKTLGIEDIPKDLTEEVISDQDDILDYLCTHRTFQFENDRIENPVFGNGLDYFRGTNVKRLGTYINRLNNGNSVANTNLDRNRFCCILHESEQERKITAKQILYVLKVLKQTYGESCVFCLDDMDATARVFTGLKLLDQVLFRQLRLKINTDEFKQKYQKVIGPNKWEANWSDAKCFDGFSLKARIAYDERPTGWVFRKESLFNICLKGLDNSYRVVFEYPGQEEEKLPNNEAELFNSTSNLFTPFLKERNKTRNNLIKAMAIKRCGDWGQAEHCKRYGKVLITKDRFLALYAYYRNVNFILIRTMLNKDEYDKVADKLWLQYTFVISKGIS